MTYRPTQLSSPSVNVLWLTWLLIAALKSNNIMREMFPVSVWMSFNTLTRAASVLCCDRNLDWKTSKQFWRTRRVLSFWKTAFSTSSFYFKSGFITAVFMAGGEKPESREVLTNCRRSDAVENIFSKVGRISRQQEEDSQCCTISSKVTCMVDRIKKCDPNWIELKTIQSLNLVLEDWRVFEFYHLRWSWICCGFNGQKFRY